MFHKNNYDSDATRLVNLSATKVFVNQLLMVWALVKV